MIKGLIIISFLLMEAFGAFINFLNDTYAKKELPDNVKDVYDEAEYARWKAYKKDNSKVDLFEKVLKLLLNLGLLFFNVYAFAFMKLQGVNVYLAYLIVLVALAIIELPITVPFGYYRTFVIEAKYGMNKSTKKTFVSDVIKSLILESILSYAIVVIIMFMFETFGNAGVIWTTVAIIVLSLVISLLVIPLMRIFNKFDSLEEGELRDKLTALCDKYGMKVRKIVVRDASRRTTKANAFCTGFGKEKTISLDDNLVNDYSADEIVAVFAHELAHAKYKHLVKSLPLSILSTTLVVVAIGIVLNVQPLFAAFGFGDVNYLFAELVVMPIIWPISNVLGLISNYLSRKHEYEADAFAAKEGYSKELIASLKRLSKESLSNVNPHPAMVALHYSHPTLSQRIDAIERAK